MKEHTHKRNIDDTGRDIDTGEQVFVIEVRPILYHEVVVGTSEHGRRRTVAPVSTEFDYGVADGYVDDELHDGETIVACVPATPGSYTVYAVSRTPRRCGVDTEWCLGSVIGGDVTAQKEFDVADWMGKALYSATQLKW